MKQKMNLITFLVFLYAGIVCAVMKPETRSGIVKIESNDSTSVSPSSGFIDLPNHQRGFTSRTLVLGGIR